MPPSEMVHRGIEGVLMVGRVGRRVAPGRGFLAALVVSLLVAVGMVVGLSPGESHAAPVDPRQQRHCAEPSGSGDPQTAAPSAVGLNK
ncbi:hypothetical protein [Gordonia sp. OPL2]|uniref:hypothetical protein n=1 Tax=Gordonia sp. OPL2 TaxID=2486274 RepID=UPI0021CCE0AC|nr:hypothetical protein [Gordonia sp. OPL2]